MKKAAAKNGVTTNTIRNWCKSDKKPDCWFERKHSETINDVQREAAAENMTPLEYMLKIMCDPSADPDRRDKMAYWAAPYVHPRGVEKKGKKAELKEKAEKVSSGKFATGKPPLKRIK
ncbi:MAG: hypothetical protein WA081_04785 [Desulfosalsimonadaceae bacterium]